MPTNWQKGIAHLANVIRWFICGRHWYSLITLFNPPPQSAGLVKHPAVPIVIFTGNVVRTRRTEAGQPGTRRFREHEAGADKSTPAISRCKALARTRRELTILTMTYTATPCVGPYPQGVDHPDPLRRRSHYRWPVPVTVQTCGDLRAFRPLAEGQPSTECPKQTVAVPSNVNSYPYPQGVDSGIPGTADESDRWPVPAGS